jgi:hypothetical protein
VAIEKPVRNKKMNPIDSLKIRAFLRNGFIILSVVFATSSSVVTSSIAADAGVNFNRDIRPILSDKCFACHGLDKLARKADLRLDQRESAIETKAIVPGRPDESSLVERILSSDDEMVMPPKKSNKPLTDEQKALLQKWIEEGAEYHPHWSFIAVPELIPIPKPVDSSNWVKSMIDSFVLDRLQQEHIEPATEATREKWLRRVSFDLTGLPPSLADLDKFLGDKEPNAFERVVDRLLESSAFGERMANEWLDVARFADTFGYQADRDTHLWPWRDWVIRAFNENLPYDQFITWQTAGDLLHDATRDQQLATAFNRLHRQTNEGGSTEEEFRQSYIADRVVTNGTAFLGLTLECARCHSHKYDPITHADFYKLAAFFSNIDEHGLYSHFTETAPTPAMPLYEGEQQARHLELISNIRSKESSLNQIREEARQRFAEHPLSKVEIKDIATLSEVLNRETSTIDPQAANPDVVVPGSKLTPKLRMTFDDAKPNGENKLVPGVSGQAIEFDGDDAFACPGSGQYGRTSPFSISLWVKPAEDKPRVAVLHQCVAAEDAAYRGFSLILDKGKLQFSLIHFWPGNAIQVQTHGTIPVNEWSQVTIVYDGSSRAAGVHLYVNGKPVDVAVIKDNLTRDIKYRAEWGDSNSSGVEMSLGARFRDVGFRHGVIDELAIYDRELSPLEVAKLSLEYPNQVPAERDVQAELASSARFEHYLLRHDEPYRTALKELQTLRDEENEFITRVRQIMVMKELPEPRPTHILKRGAYDAPGELVTADTPASILPFPKEFPRNRLGLAKWMIDHRNPLPSRVAVNRIWSLFFGRGLVASVEDFGGQGQSPSHPELLDWLARDFMNHGWNVKRFCKEIVLSATYCQSSQPRDLKLYVEDPDNKLLGRGPRYRLSAEQIRDNALAISGLLVSKIGGASVMPYQPAGLWEEAGTGKSYAQSKGEGLYRRSLYTFWRRTSPPPSMLTFDATGRETCTARRERTATPLQSLVLLNDPQFIEAARMLAQKLLEQRDIGINDQILAAFRILTSRSPSEKEMLVLTRLYREQKSHFESVPNDAREFLAIGDTRRDEQINAADHAAMTVLVKTLMSFDECVTKR